MGVKLREVRPRDTTGWVSAEEYNRKHDLRVEGGNVPEAFQTFESVGFPHDIMDEVRSCLRGRLSMVLGGWEGARVCAMA
jgi:hypothetical protein